MRGRYEGKMKVFALLASKVDSILFFTFVFQTCNCIKNNDLCHFIVLYVVFAVRFDTATTATAAATLVNAGVNVIVCRSFLLLPLLFRLTLIEWLEKFCTVTPFVDFPSEIVTNDDEINPTILWLKIFIKLYSTICHFSLTTSTLMNTNRFEQVNSRGYGFDWSKNIYSKITYEIDTL